MALRCEAPEARRVSEGALLRAHDLCCLSIVLVLFLLGLDLLQDSGVVAALRVDEHGFHLDHLLDLLCRQLDSLVELLVQLLLQGASQLRELLEGILNQELHDNLHLLFHIFDEIVRWALLLLDFLLDFKFEDLGVQEVGQVDTLVLDDLLFQLSEEFVSGHTVDKPFSLIRMIIESLLDLSSQMPLLVFELGRVVLDHVAESEGKLLEFLVENLVFVIVCLVSCWHLSQNCLLVLLLLFKLLAEKRLEGVQHVSLSLHKLLDQRRGSFTYLRQIVQVTFTKCILLLLHQVLERETTFNFFLGSVSHTDHSKA